MPAAISFRDVSFAPFFEYLSFDVEAGSTTLVITSREEESTALLRLITGTASPLSGKVLLNGEDISGVSLDQLYHLRRKLGIIPSSGGLISNLKIWENITLPLFFGQAQVREQETETVLDYLQQLGYSASISALPAHLSLCDKRTAAMARAASLHPAIMVYCNSLEGLSEPDRQRLCKAAVMLQGEIPLRTSLHLASSAEHAGELSIDTQIDLSCLPSRG